MKKILVQAFLAKNLGDDLFIKVLCERYKKIKFIIIDKKENRNTLNKIHNLTFINEDLFIFKLINRLYSTIKKSLKMRNYLDRKTLINTILCFCMNHNIYITGSGFMESKNWEDTINLKWFKTKPYILGCNFGPYKNEQYYETYKELFQYAKQVSFRDKYSYELFKDLSNIQYAPDIVFTLDVSKYITEKSSNKYIISVTNPFKDDYDNVLTDNQLLENYKKKISEIVIQLVKEKKDVNLISFCDEQGDMDIIFSVLTVIPEELKTHISILNYTELGMEAILKVIGRSEGIITTRFHGIILGLLFKKKIIPLIYSTKMTHILDDINYQGSRFFVNNMDEIKTNELNNYWGTMPESARELVIKEAEQHFNLLDKELYKYK